MTEGVLTRRLMELLRAVPGAVVFKYNDRTTSGIPDISFTYWGQTTWLEIKVGAVRGKSIQLRTMTLLEQASRQRAWYVVYDETQTRICRPQSVARVNPLTVAGVSLKPRDHRFVVDWLVDQHHAARD